ncbi:MULTISPECIES: hypothetical protein [Vibrio]|uniref:hypothetical protein n=1 Tax=Vibrio TaxID=662 RepID=UPI00105449C6|nr:MULTISPECIES: hypothetical protein [Vibrio]NVN83733.1 hypothetical protein [Vibrio sp. Scap16]QLE94129.1 hypothetical protein FLM53_14335 [Vibrio sp. Scap24]
MNDTRIYNVYIKEYMFLPFERLCDPVFKHLLGGVDAINNATLYAIGKVPKAKIDLKSFTFIDNFCVRGDLEVAGKRHAIVFNMAKFWYEGESEISLKLQSDFKSLNEFTNYFMGKYKAYDGSEVPSHVKYQYLARVDLEASNDTTLFVNCPLVKAMYGFKDMETEIPTYQLMQKFDIECFESVDLCYIGKSKGSLKRLMKHEKWLEVLALSKRNPQYDYLVYFFTIDDDDIKQIKRTGFNILHRDYTQLNAVSAAELCEAALVNYFKPVLNDKLKDSELSGLKVVKNNLLEKGYTSLVAEVELEGLFGKLSTENRTYKKRHVAEFDLQMR